MAERAPSGGDSLALRKGMQLAFWEPAVEFPHKRIACLAEMGRSEFERNRTRKYSSFKKWIQSLHKFMNMRRYATEIPRSEKPLRGQKLSIDLVIILNGL
jgi:hypothetical protein